MAMTPAPAIFDEAAARRRLSLAAAGGSFPGFLHEHAAQELLSRLDSVLRRFDGVVAHGAHASLLAHGPGSVWRAATIRTAAADFLVASDDLPVKPESLGCVLMLFGPETVNDIPGLLQKVRQALKPDGLFLCATIAGETLRELREAWAVAESELSGGVTPRVAPFAGVRDLGNLLQCGWLCAAGGR